MNPRKTWKIFICGCLILMVTGFNCATAGQPDNKIKFAEAGKAYQGEDFKKAVKLYEEILQSGEESGPLYYNLGNSYFKTGQLGKAVLNYERAKVLMPRDSDLKANYQFALSQMKSAETGIRSFIDRALDAYGNFFNLDELVLILFFSFFLTGALYFFGLFLKWPRKPYLGSILAMCALLFFHGFIFTRKYDEYNHQAVVLKETAAKFEPLNDATTHFELSPGMKVKLLREEGGWFKVRRSDGRMGWVKTENIGKI